MYQKASEKLNRQTGFGVSKFLNMESKFRFSSIFFEHSLLVPPTGNLSGCIPCPMTYFCAC